MRGNGDDFPIVGMPGRPLPHSLDAERQLVATILTYPECLEPVRGIVKPDDICFLPLRRLFASVLEMAAVGLPIEAGLVMGRLRGDSDAVAELRGLVDQPVTGPISAHAYAALVRDNADLRRAIEIVEESYLPAAEPDAILAKLGQLRESRPRATGGRGGLDLADLAAAEYPPLVEFVSNLICQGLTLLCAKPKVGKSWLVLDIALARAGGGCAAGSLQCTKGETLALMLEDSNRRLKGRIAALIDKRDVPRGAIVFTKWPRGDQGIAALVAWLDAHPDVDLVVIDTLAKFIGPSDGNGSLYQSDYERLNAIHELAQERNIAIVVLHHLRKADGDDALDLVSGTLGLTGAADHIVVITGNRDSGHKLTARGRDLPDVAWDMAFDRGRWTVLGNSAPKNKHLDIVERIERDNRIRELRETGLSEREIAKEAGCPRSTVNHVLKKVNGGGQ